MRYADRDRHGADQPNQHNNPEQRHHTTKDTSRRIAQLRCTALKLLTIASWADVDHSCWSLDVECRYCRRRGPGLMLKGLIPEPWDVVVFKITWWALMFSASSDMSPSALTTVLLEVNPDDLVQSNPPLIFAGEIKCVEWVRSNCSNAFQSSRWRGESAAQQTQHTSRHPERRRPGHPSCSASQTRRHQTQPRHRTTRPRHSGNMHQKQTAIINSLLRLMWDIPKVQEHGILLCVADRAMFWWDGRPPSKCLYPAPALGQALEAARQGQGEKPKRHHFH